MDAETYESYKQGLQTVKDYLDELDTFDDAGQLCEALKKVNSFLSMIAYVQADLKKIKRQEERKIFETRQAFYITLPALQQKKYIDDCTDDISELVEKAEGLGTAMVHIGDNIRTQISFRKEELKLTRKGY